MGFCPPQNAFFLEKFQTVTFRGWTLDSVEMCFSMYEDGRGREPTAVQLKEWIAARQHQILVDDGMLLLKVDMANSAKTIKDEFEKLINSEKVRRKMAEAKPQLMASHYRSLKPTGKPPLYELQEYLKVYDMWRDKVRDKNPGGPGGWKIILEYFEPKARPMDSTERIESFKRKHGKKPGVVDLQEMLEKENKRYASLERRYKRYKEKAAKIISNVEMGYFPGEY